MSDVEPAELDPPASIDKPALPVGWSWGEVADVGAKQKNAIVDGPFGSNLKLTDYVEGGTVPVLTTKNLAGKYDDLRYISEEKFQELKRSAVYPNDILMAKIGSCGKTGIYPVNMPPAIIPANLLKVTLSEKFDKRFVFHYFNSRFFQRALKTIIRASAQPAFGVTSFRKLPFPIAPLGEQLQVVAEIEKQFSRLDEAVANLQRVKANLKRYKASVLKAAVEGRLVETEATLARREGRTYETGEQLLQRILDERGVKWAGKGKYVEPESTNVPHLSELPEGWTWASAVQACERVVDCHNKTAPYTSAGIPLVRTTNIKDGRMHLDDTRYVDEPTYEFWSRRCPPAPGDVLFTREAPMGEAGIIPPGVKLCLGQRTMLMRPSPAISSSFLLSALLSPVVKDLIDRVAVGSGVKHLRVGDVERLPVPLPPVAEQARIVAEVDRHLSIIREVETEVDANLQRAQSLRQATLASAFGSRN